MPPRPIWLTYNSFTACRVDSVPIEITKIGLWSLIPNHFRLGHSGFNPHFGMSLTPTRWDENMAINCGMWCVLKLQKPVSLTYHLHVQL